MQNPNSHERLKSWSDLPLDLLNSVFERLSFVNFQRAKSVCTSWHFASRQCVPKSKQIHWLILFPEDNDNSSHYHSCRLFNLEEKDKLYKTQDLGLEFARSDCIATYGSWLLMRDPLCNLFIVNLFTLERISLPPTESQTGMITKLERTLDGRFRVTSHDGKEYTFKDINMRCPAFWVDEKTKDYVVFWGLRDLCVVYSKRGDTLWNQIPETSGCCHVVYKDSKLYMVSLYYGYVIIFDFSGEIPQRKLHRSVAFVSSRFGNLRDSLLVTVTGDLLTVERTWRRRSSTWYFRVIKICSSGFDMKPQRIKSLRDETMLLDQGITVLADDNDGFIRNSMYYSFTSGENTKGMFLFNLETGKTEPVHTFDCSSVHFSRARWFLPSFRRT
ncbi:unnamed protein product [Thlaspi arvense]|uniref:F-box domain-containing protein n=1 Tax=Thlaspi arvense TaxID=13288 RepID=A0AAU9T296_THLAR|nr:unnamed protein product [Thlaspi arvense]